MSSLRSLRAISMEERHDYTWPSLGLAEAYAAAVAARVLGAGAHGGVASEERFSDGSHGAEEVPLPQNGEVELSLRCQSRSSQEEVPPSDDESAEKVIYIGKHWTGR
eukprot:CAMPEP_0185572348 /NCGR_PEP_ID=MMETSP0434-20130131/4295_1 /TAXON_ID=626734 ORGANISM="Favella taraikaensis, Strain Fe Narragansett Bay" /NCGR_SAMPLE_ID=MMETSP0434 /ASSEMBLY_ACC=CAM_ASM_000379 /LENGTH=106 /DNA_ID=CAMNT_0028188191 /DNA_START=1404 /DNA_END=1725 /DNA_ORIENTATION=+